MKVFNFKSLFLAAASLVCVSASAQVSFTQDRDFRDLIGWPCHRGVPIMADLNGDDIMDAYYGGTSCTNGWTARGTLIKGLGEGKYEGVFTPKYETYTTQEAIIMKDADGNYVTDEEGNYVYVTDENGEIVTEEVEHQRLIGMENGLPLSVRGMASQPIDFNNDGLVDLLIANTGGNDTGTEQRLVLVKNLGNYQFEVVQDETLEKLPYRGQGEGFNADGRLGAVMVADYDHDGCTDILYMNDWTWDPVLDVWGSCTYLVRNNKGTFERANVFKPLPYDQEINHYRLYTYTDVTVDEDGIEVPGGFTDEPTMAIKPLRGGAVNFVDLNNDGWEDIVINGWADSKNDERNGYEIRYYENLQDGFFQDATDKLAAALGCDGLADLFGKYASADNSFITVDYDQNGTEDLLLVGSMNRDKKQAVVFLNASEDGTLALVESTTTLAPSSGTDARAFFFADFSGDDVCDMATWGWSDYNERYTWTATFCVSQGAVDTYANEVYDGPSDMFGAHLSEEGCTLGDLNNDGKLDFLCTDWTDKADDLIPSFNTTDYVPQAPDAPTNVTATADENGNVTIEWEGSSLASGGNAIYNVCIKNEATGEVRMTVPANAGTGKQSGYAKWGTYVSGTKYVAAAVAAGTYTIGVQAVNYSYVASPFTTITVQVGGEDGIQQVANPQSAEAAYYTIEGIRLNGAPAKGVYVVKEAGKAATKVIK